MLCIGLESNKGIDVVGSCVIAKINILLFFHINVMMG